MSFLGSILGIMENKMETTILITEFVGSFGNHTSSGTSCNSLSCRFARWHSSRNAGGLAVAGALTLHILNGVHLLKSIIEVLAYSLNASQLADEQRPQQLRKARNHRGDIRVILG